MTPGVAALLGAAVGLGLCLVVAGLPRAAGAGSAGGRPSRAPVAATLIAESGLRGLTPRGLWWATTMLGVFGTATWGLLSGAAPVGVVFGLAMAWAPWAWLRHRRAARLERARGAWPDAVDQIASGIRAGLSLPEAVGGLATRGPEHLRPHFAAFADEYRTTGSVWDGLDQLQLRLSDPVGDRLVESLRMAQRVGGGDLGRLLRSLATVLRDDARAHGELRARQSWVVNAARLAVAGPWLMLALMALRGNGLAAFGTTGGAFVLAGGAGVCVVAYLLMMRIGRLPEEPRVVAPPVASADGTARAGGGWVR